jgi:hypothetical protein
MTCDDLISGLELVALGRDPETGCYALRLDHQLFTDLIERWDAKSCVKVNPEGLMWSPFIMGGSKPIHLDTMDIVPAVVWLGTTNCAPTDANGESASPPSRWPLVMQESSPNATLLPFLVPYIASGALAKFRAISPARFVRRPGHHSP